MERLLNNVRLWSFKGLARFNGAYLFLYLLTMAFFVRWEIVMALVHWSHEPVPALKLLGFQLLSMALGIGLAIVVRKIIFDENRWQDGLFFVGYLGLLYLVLKHTGLLWSRFGDVQNMVLMGVIIGLLRIIEKQHIGVFKKSRSDLQLVLWAIFIFFLIVDYAYTPMGGEKLASVSCSRGADEMAMFAKNAEALKGLKQEQWERLEPAAKLNLMQTVVNIELSHLGLPHDVQVKSREMGKGINATYSDKQLTVYVNAKRLQYATAREMLNSVAHESYHAYQHRMVEVYKAASEEQKQLLYLRKLAAYDYELTHYVHGLGNYEGYYSQAVEQDAREYGQQRAQFYYSSI